MNLQDFETQLVDFEMDRGFSLYKNNILSECKEVKTGKWEAIVRGSDYGINIEIKGGIVLKSKCTCPDGISFCKHIIATLYAIKYGPYDTMNAYPVVQKTKPAKKEKEPKVTFPAQVRKVSLEELQHFIIEYAKSDKELKNIFQASFIEDAPAGMWDYISIINDAEDIAAYKTPRGYIDAYHTRIIFKPISILLEKANKALTDQQYEVVSDIALAIIKCITDFLEYGMDDSHGVSDRSVLPAFKLLEQLHGRDVPSDVKEAIFEDSLDVFFGTDYGSTSYEENWKNYLGPLMNGKGRKKKVISAIDSEIEYCKKAGKTEEKKLAELISQRAYYLSEQKK